MKNYLLATFLFAAMLGVSCGNSNNQVNKNADTATAGNTDSSGSQPVQPGPGSANASDTIAHEQPPRTDSVIKH